MSNTPIVNFTTIASTDIVIAHEVCLEDDLTDSKSLLLMTADLVGNPKYLGTSERPVDPEWPPTFLNIAEELQQPPLPLSTQFAVLEQSVGQYPTVLIGYLLVIPPSMVLSDILEDWFPHLTERPLDGVYSTPEWVRPVYTWGLEELLEGLANGTITTSALSQEPTSKLSDVE